MQTAKMIHPDKKLAGAILDKMKKQHPNDEWSVMVEPTSFQVTRKPKPLFGGYSASCKPLPGSAKLHVPVGSVVNRIFSDRLETAYRHIAVEYIHVRQCRRRDRVHLAGTFSGRSRAAVPAPTR
jgi:hypothetical protein